MKHSRTMFCLFVVLLSMCLVGYAGNIPEQQYPQPDEIITYKTIGEITLGLHVFRPKDHKASDKRACIVLFHGGNWAVGSPAKLYPRARHFAERGFVAISVRFRITNDGKDTVTRFDTVKDAKSAIRWIREHCTDLGIDPNKIISCGNSSGGHMACAVGVINNIEDKSDDGQISHVPNAVINLYGVVDNSPEGYGWGAVKEKWQEFSPLHNISEKTPPTIMFYGTNDGATKNTVPEKYKEAMEKFGRKCELHAYKAEEHGFTNYKDGENYFYFESIVQSEKFLKSLGFMDGEVSKNPVAMPPEPQLIKLPGKITLKDPKTKKKTYYFMGDDGNRYALPGFVEKRLDVNFAKLAGKKVEVSAYRKLSVKKGSFDQVLSIKEITE